MTPMALLALVAAVVACCLVVALVVRLPISGRAISPFSTRQNIRNIIVSQREARDSVNNKEGPSVVATALQEETVERSAENRLTIRKKLRFAQLPNVPPYAFSLAQIFVSLVMFLITSMFFDSVLQIIALLSGAVFMNWLLNRRIDRRFERFDADYPQFLLAFVGMLKTGLNPIQGLQAAAEGLEESSLVREEVQIMLERLRMGVSEERSIGSFGEDIHHPEIELFVQALILSRRVGGNLSATIDRLAKQVRRRQFFRRSANAAVGLQRGSIWFILAILMALEGYLYFVWPECVTITWTHPTGRSVGQAGLTGIVIGLFWIRQVTKLRV
ncbi:MAG: type II secretion system F family protein [Proteobacteria bacterium]|nr:type II secretion system F family protein [Pseudomonadota bacterium]